MSMLVNCDEDEFVENLHNLKPSRVYESKRTLWAWMGSYKQVNANDPNFLHGLFGGHFVWPFGLEKAMNENGYRRDGDRHGDWYFAKKDMIIGNTKYEEDTGIFLTYGGRSHLRVPVLQIAYSFEEEKLGENYPRLFQYTVNIPYSLELETPENRKTLPLGFQENITKYDWVEPVEDAYRIDFPKGVAIIKGKPQTLLKEMAKVLFEPES